MTRLIDADALNYSTHTECAGHGDYYDIEIITKSKIDNAPTIDAVEVVRCKDCIRNIRNTDGVDEDWCYKFGYEIDETDFCSYGERREP